MTREEVVTLLLEMEATYSSFRIRDRQTTLKVWERQLAAYPAAAIQAAFDRYAATETTGFAPSPGQLLEQLRLAGDEKRMTGMEAWDKVYKAVGRSAYYAAEEFSKLPQEIQRAVGSPSVLRGWSQLDEDAMGPVRSNFLRVYETQAKKSREDALIPPKLREALRSVTDQLGSEGQMLLEGGHDGADR
jgi:hypothetical protein